MSVLCDRMVAADDAQEFAHDHVVDIIREMMKVEQALKMWETMKAPPESSEGVALAGQDHANKLFYAGVAACAKGMREAMV